MKKNHFGLFFHVLSNSGNVKEQFEGAQKVIWQEFCKLYDHTFRTCDIQKQIFQKSAIFPVKKDFGFFLQFIVYDEPQKQILRVDKVFWR